MIAMKQEYVNKTYEVRKMKKKEKKKEKDSCC